jgi:hypothetical protein
MRTLRHQLGERAERRAVARHQERCYAGRLVGGELILEALGRTAESYFVDERVGHAAAASPFLPAR